MGWSRAVITLLYQHIMNLGKQLTSKALPACESILLVCGVHGLCCVEGGIVMNTERKCSGGLVIVIQIAY